MKEVAVVPGQHKRLDTALRRLKTCIDAYPAIGPLPLADAHAHLAAQGVALPLAVGVDDVRWSVAYTAPAGVHVVGSYLLGTATRPAVNVDVAVDMPAVRPGPRTGAHRERQGEGHRHRNTQRYARLPQGGGCRALMVVCLASPRWRASDACV
jgi:hypothetical protein